MKTQYKTISFKNLFDLLSEQGFEPDRPDKGPLYNLATNRKRWNGAPEEYFASPAEQHACKNFTAQKMM